MNQDLKDAIDRLNRAIDALEKRQAAKAIVGALANLNYSQPLPSDETIDGWSGQEIDVWWTETEPLLPSEEEVGG